MTPMIPFDFSLVTAPFRMQPGLRRVASGAAQLTPSVPGGRHLREKTIVLATFAQQALVAMPDVDTAALLSAIAAEAARTTPIAFAVDASIGLDADAPLLGWSIRDGEPVGQVLNDWGNTGRMLVVNTNREEGIFSALILEDTPDFGVGVGTFAAGFRVVRVPKRVQQLGQKPVTRLFARLQGGTHHRRGEVAFAAAVAAPQGQPARAGIQHLPREMQGLLALNRFGPEVVQPMLQLAGRQAAGRPPGMLVHLWRHHAAIWAGHEFAETSVAGLQVWDTNHL